MSSLNTNLVSVRVYLNALGALAILRLNTNLVSVRGSSLVFGTIGVIMFKYKSCVGSSLILECIAFCETRINTNLVSVRDSTIVNLHALVGSLNTNLVSVRETNGFTVTSSTKV